MGASNSLYKLASDGHTDALEQALTAAREAGTLEQLLAESLADQALVCAACNRDVRAVKLLIEAGAPLDAQLCGITALHFAARRGAVNIVRLLLEAGADPNIRSSGDLTQLDTPLHTAVEHGRSEIIQLLLQAGADVHARDENSSTPLILAARGPQRFTVPTQQQCADLAGTELELEPKRLQSVQLLLQAGAALEAEDSEGCTALGKAILVYDPAIVAALIHGGADVNHLFHVGQRLEAPLLRAVIDRKPGYVSLLLAAGATVDLSSRRRGFAEAGPGFQAYAWEWDICLGCITPLAHAATHAARGFSIPMFESLVERASTLPARRSATACTDAALHAAMQRNTLPDSLHDVVTKLLTIAAVKDPAAARSVLQSFVQVAATPSAAFATGVICQCWLKAAAALAAEQAQLPARQLMLVHVADAQQQAEAAEQVSQSFGLMRTGSTEAAAD